MKEKLFKLITEEVYEVGCHYYIDGEEDNCYCPKGIKIYYFTNKDKAEDFYWKHRDDHIQSYGCGYISNASSPYKTERTCYSEVSEEEVRKILEDK